MKIKISMSMNTALKKLMATRAMAWVLLATCSLPTGFGGHAFAQAPAAPIESNAKSLLEKHAALQTELVSNAYGRPLFLESVENPSMITGNAYAVLDTPFATVSSTFKSPRHWCDVMILHINTKYCRAVEDTSPSMLKVNVGKKSEQDLSDTFALEFAMRTVAATTDYLALQLNAEKGPLGTRNYRIELEAAPLRDGKTFMHLRYSYGYGLTGRLAMQGYLATVGSGKAGFTQTSRGHTPTYVGGMRGAVERNTMRYYLAIDAYLSSQQLPAAQQFNARLNKWFNATEQYPAQFGDLDKEEYLSMKKNEYRRQTAAGS